MPRQPLIVGNPVLVVVDIQEGGGMSAEQAGIPVMPGHAERVKVAERLVGAVREAGVPVVFFQEVHRASGVDFGRELDGTEGVHCVEGQPGTDLEPTLRPLPNEFHIVKRRYSGFIGTDFEIVLRGLKASTLILIGGLTDVCVHYTFADAHQRDYYVRVVTDCVGGSSQYRHDAALDAMEYLQTGALRTSDEIIEAFQNLSAAPTLEGAAR
ncbi:cysteine hydrolase family protein [Mycolicibacterium phlei]|uniref:cysteine hydrolase family protein n=1 Tax=Mycolicibacterium phlei TaxID=1771 RepID=UPI00025AF244|nr:cysteine hydrolase [Mycolicibacterium phlei]EID12408.1 isochorismatase hydrolase [Mycolicibacterium phlei RIVM601174]MBF4191881.1 isochorismatase hydrolase [Mycolicibacterium phlei]